MGSQALFSSFIASKKIKAIFLKLLYTDQVQGEVGLCYSEFTCASVLTCIYDINFEINERKWS